MTLTWIQSMATSWKQASACILSLSLALTWLMPPQHYYASAATSLESPHPWSEIPPSADDSQDKVNLSVYYESLCPYCANFIVKQLVKIFQTGLIDIVNLRLVPWGNTQIQPNNTWICQHGVDECRLDVAEACAIDVWPSVQTHFKFIYCVERLHLMDKHVEWQSCFSSSGLEPDALESCYNNGVGYQLEKAYADETANLNPRHRFVPWVVVNNYPLQENFENFVGYICKAYRGYSTPDACKSSSSFELINSSEAASFTSYTTSLQYLSGGKN